MKDARPARTRREENPHLRAARLLARRDPVMARLVRRFGPIAPLRRRPGGSFAFLARAVVYQQLAGRAAAAIHGRLVDLLGGPPRPETLLAAPVGRLRSVGLSRTKVETLRDLARKWTDGTIPATRLWRMDDADVVEALGRVRGIGRWTAEMFLLFHLRRPDVWPVTDYGVRKGWARAYGLEEPPAPAELERLGERHRPHRSTAALYLWRAADGDAWQ